MIGENLKNLRKAKGLSQEELAIRLNVVRQTVSKWEKGLSVPDAEQVIAISECFEVPVGELLGSELPAAEAGESARLAEQLALMNAQLADRNRRNRRTLRVVSIILCCLSVLLLITVLAPSLYGLSISTGARSIGVIGGADGPTAIFITAVGINWPALLALLAALAASIAGLVISRR